MKYERKELDLSFIRNNLKIIHKKRITDFIFFIEPFNSTYKNPFILRKKKKVKSTKPIIFALLNSFAGSVVSC